MQTAKLIRATDEELAFGARLRRFIVTNIVAAVIIFICFIIVAISSVGDASVLSSPAFYVLPIVGAMILTVGIIGIKQRKKFIEDFHTRPIEEQENIKAHFAAMKKIHGRKI